MDASGNLYGAAANGGDLPACNCGLVFELVKPTIPGGLWAEQTLYRFGTVPNDAVNPGPYLVLHAGALYGLAAGGGPPGYGAVFQLARQSGVWTETVLHRFNGEDGLYLSGGLSADGAGNLYGTLNVGGDAACFCGVVFELSPPAVAGDPWQDTVLYNFTRGADGAFPEGKLWRSALGDLYGITKWPGTTNSLGEAFKLSAPGASGGTWSLTVLHDFAGEPSDARGSDSELTPSHGRLYGTSIQGGRENYGAVFSVVP
jgi:hypothetical protein